MSLPETIKARGYHSRVEIEFKPKVLAELIRCYYTMIPNEKREFLTCLDVGRLHDALNKLARAEVVAIDKERERLTLKQIAKSMAGNDPTIMQGEEEYGRAEEGYSQSVS